MNNAQLEILFNHQKKTYLTGYLLYFFTGGIGGSMWYIGDKLFALATLFVAFYQVEDPSFTMIWYGLVLIGLPYTGFGIHNYNENLKKELEILHGNGYNSEIK